MSTAMGELESIFAQEPDGKGTGIGEALIALARRIDQIEARQRANEHHDPDCDQLRTMKAQRRTGAYVVQKPCNCWLAPLVEAKEGPHSRACGPLCRGHGPECHSNCPTCGGKA